MAQLSMVSTDQVAPKERIPYWKDVIWQQLGRLRSDARSDGVFRGSLAHCDAGDVRSSAACPPPAIASRAPPI
ncbi:MAG: hypothetical protein M5R42_01765 [Rhodocyclaceae bacterium]|nr:hypothetical protein [Rhodocyclaceae bacterium]